MFHHNPANISPHSSILNNFQPSSPSAQSRQLANLLYNKEQSPTSFAHDFSMNQQLKRQINNRQTNSINNNEQVVNNMISSSAQNRNKDDQQRQQLLEALLSSSNNTTLTNITASTNVASNFGNNNNTNLMNALRQESPTLPSNNNDASYLWKQYELAAALCQLMGGANGQLGSNQLTNNQATNNDLTTPSINPLSLVLQLLANQDLSLNLNNLNPINANFNFNSNTQELPLDTQQLSNPALDETLFSNQLSPDTPSPFKVQQQPTAPSSTLLAKLHTVTSRQNAHILSTKLDYKIIDLLEALYLINDNPDSAAIEMIARRTNVLAGLINNWFDDKRRLLNPNAGPKSPPAKKRAGGRVVTFSEYQRSLLEAIFDENNYLHPQEYEELSNLIQVPSRNIKIWFKNRRSKKRLSGRMIS